MLSKREIKQIRASGTLICSTCQQTEDETEFYPTDPSKYLCKECRSDYMSNRRRARNKMSPKPKKVIEKTKAGRKKEYTDAMYLLERSLILLKNQNRLVSAEKSYRKSNVRNCATISDIIFAVHQENRKSNK